MFVRVLELLLRKRAITLLLLASVSIPAVFAVLGLRLDPRWTSALPRNDPLIDEYLEITQDPLRGSRAYVLVDGEQKEQAAARFVEQAEELPHVRYVQGIASEVLPYELLLLPRGQLQSLKELSGHLNFGDFAAYLYRESVTADELPSISEDGEQFYAYTRLFLGDLADALEGNDHPSAEQAVESLFAISGELRSSDGEALLLQLGTDISEDSIGELDRFAVGLEEIQAEMRIAYPEVEIRATGYPVTAFDEMRRIRRSGEQLTLWALAIVLLTMRLFFGGFRDVLVSVGVLLISLLWIMGMVRIVFGDLNSVTMIMGLVLVGLGIDFCIHWLNSYRREYQAGHRGIALAGRVLQFVGKPILTGAATTAGAFLCVLLLDVPSLREFAWMSAIGILLTAAMVLFVMPVLGPPGRRPHAGSAWITQRLVGVTSVALHRPRRTAGVFLLLLLIAIGSLRDLKYEYNYARLQIGGLPSYELKQEIIDRFDLSSDVLVLRVDGVESAEAIKKDLLKLPEIARVESISDYLPSPGEQWLRAQLISDILERMEQAPPHRYGAEDLEELRDLAFLLSELLPFEAPDEATHHELLDLSVELQRIEGALISESLARLNEFNADWVSACRRSLRARARTEPLSFEDVPQAVQSEFRTSEPGVYLEYIYPAGNVWEKDPAKALETALADHAPMAAGLSRVSFRLTGILFSKGLRMALAALAVVLIVLRISLSSWGMALLAAVPLACGGLLTAATLARLGIPINFYNLVGIPIILGIGIDDGVHLVHAFRAGGGTNPVAAVRATGSAILLTSLTSMVGFGCLSFYQHPGMATLGVVLVTGVAWCLVTTLILLPVFLQFLHARPDAAGSD